MSARPPLTRQASVQRIQENQDNVGGCISFCYLPAAIAAIIIAKQYDESSSACAGKQYTVDLVDFLLIAGGIQIGYSVLYFLGLCLRQESCMKGLNQCYSCIGLFFFAWSVIGLVIYDQQMSSECQNEPIGIMILSWSVIQLTLGFAICCCICIVLICGASLFAIFGADAQAVQSDIGDNDADPLKAQDEEI